MRAPRTHREKSGFSARVHATLQSFAVHCRASPCQAPNEKFDRRGVVSQSQTLLEMSAGLHRHRGATLALLLVLPITLTAVTAATAAAQSAGAGSIKGHIRLTG